MAGRKPDPMSPYRVYMHTLNGKYAYAAIQVRTEKDGNQTKPKIIHLGRLENVNGKIVFKPNSEYKLMPVTERLKLIFPAEWDISAAEVMNNMKYVQQEQQVKQSSVKVDTSEEHSEVTDLVQNDSSSELAKPSDTTLDQFNNKLYGSFWLLEMISENSGVYEDLMKTFDGNIPQVHEIMSLAFFPYLSGKSYSRFAKWQNSHQNLLDYPLKSPAITRLTQSITDNHRMKMIQLRLARQPKNAKLDCDSTTRSGWGKCLVDLYWGTNKDNPKLQNTVEAYVYSLTTHEPVYYRSFSGSTIDISTIRTILSDLLALGIKDVILIADRGYPSEENLAALVEASIPFLMCSKIGSKPIAPLLLDIKYDNSGLPEDMEYDSNRRLYYTQVDVPPYKSEMADGTEVNMESVKANLFLNSRRRTDELEVLRTKIKEEKAILDKAVKDQEIPADIKKYNAMFDYFKVSLTVDEKGNANGIVFSRCEEKIKKEQSQCGYFGSLLFNVNVNAKQSLDIYKSRDEHEKNFDQLKNQMLYYNQRNSSEDGRNGRSFISFVGLIPISKLRYAWKTQMMNEYESSLDMLDEMESIRYSEYTDGTSSMTTFTTKQVNICTACGVKPPKECMPATVRKKMERQENPKKRGRKAKSES